MTYDLFLEPEVYDARRELPGNLRQRVRRMIDALAETPRPAESQLLDLADVVLPPVIEMRRIRVERWRIIYAVCDTEHWVWLLAIRRRPPHNYDDLPELVRSLPNVEAE